MEYRDYTLVELLNDPYSERWKVFLHVRPVSKGVGFGDDLCLKYVVGDLSEKDSLDKAKRFMKSLTRKLERKFKSRIVYVNRRKITKYIYRIFEQNGE
jgi:hypothetical protein